MKRSWRGPVSFPSHAPYLLFITTPDTNIRTSGVTAMIVGKAIMKANAQAFNHFVIIPSIIPTLIIEMASDMMHDIRSDIKNENEIGRAHV